MKSKLHRLPRWLRSMSGHWALRPRRGQSIAAMLTRALLITVLIVGVLISTGVSGIQAQTHPRGESPGNAIAVPLISPCAKAPKYEECGTVTGDFRNNWPQEDGRILDTNWFRFSAKAGWTYQIIAPAPEAMAGRVGVGSLSLLDQSGASILASADTARNHFTLVWVAPSSGDYLLRYVITFLESSHADIPLSIHVKAPSGGVHPVVDDPTPSFTPRPITPTTTRGNVPVAFHLELQTAWDPRTSGGNPLAIDLSGSDAETCELDFLVPGQLFLVQQLNEPGKGDLILDEGDRPCVAGSPANSDEHRVLYIPNDGFSGKDSFTYAVTDSDGNVSAPATVVITVIKQENIGDEGGGTCSAPLPLGGKAEPSLFAVLLGVIGLVSVRRRFSR